MTALPPALFDQLAGILADALLADLEAHPVLEENSPIAGPNVLQSEKGPEGGRRLQLVSNRDGGNG